MYIPFSSLPAHARIWIYQSDKKILSDQKDIIIEALTSFTEQWTVHGAPMDASFEIRQDYFVILAANDPASGCSIDSSVRAVQSAGARVGIDFFNRNLVAFKIANTISLVALKDLRQKLEHGEWSGDTLVFNNLVQNVKEFQQSWLVPAKETWLARYLAKQSMTR
jgi:hypothetical protein